VLADTSGGTPSPMRMGKRRSAVVIIPADCLSL